MTQEKEIATIENKIEQLNERIDNIEKQMKEDKEEQIKKLEAELYYVKSRCISDSYEGFILNNLIGWMGK